jgi:hypothetical protein
MEYKVELPKLLDGKVWNDLCYFKSAMLIFTIEHKSHVAFLAGMQNMQ